jgi:hypothetical protein
VHIRSPRLLTLTAVAVCLVAGSVPDSARAGAMIRPPLTPAAASQADSAPNEAAASSVGPRPSRTTRIGFWHGGFAPDCPQGGCPLDAFPKGTWRALRETDAFLGLGLTYGVDYGPGSTSEAALRFIRRAHREDVDVEAWVLADQDGGVFAHESNAPLMRQAVKSLHAWNQRHRLGIREAILDLEFPVGTQLNDLPRLQAGIDPAHQCAAVRSYRGTIRWARERGLTVSGSPIPFAMDDLLNGDMALADALDVAPVLRGYHRLYLQAYRTYSNTGPDYVSGYLLGMRTLFGTAGEVTLGDTTMAEPYLRVAPLIDDVRLAAGLGARRVPIFNLTGSLSKYGVSGLRRLGNAAHDPMTPVEIGAATRPNPFTLGTRSFFAGLDASATTLATPSGANRFPHPCP